MRTTSEQARAHQVRFKARRERVKVLVEYLESCTGELQREAGEILREDYGIAQGRPFKGYGLDNL